MGLGNLEHILGGEKKEAHNIQVRLDYNDDDGTRPYKFGRPRRNEEMDHYKSDEGGSRRHVSVLVRDGRFKQLSLDENSFELVKHDTSLSTEDFYDQKKVTDIYYKEIAETIKKATGASAIQIFHHQVRNPEKNNGGELHVNTSIQGYANRIHLDTHPLGCQETFKYYVEKLGMKDLQSGRFVVLNAWRNISDTPIGKDHLAVLDETSLVKPDDYITGDFFGESDGKEYIVPQYLLNCRNYRQHRWFYFSRMRKDEVLLFKMFDSDTTKTGRSCFHTAFADPEAPQLTPCRQSIEIRAFAYFPDHEPNTCPPTSQGILVPEVVFPYEVGGIL